MTQPAAQGPAHAFTCEGPAPPLRASGGLCSAFPHRPERPCRAPLAEPGCTARGRGGPSDGCLTYLNNLGSKSWASIYTKNLWGGTRQAKDEQPEQNSIRTSQGLSDVHRGVMPLLGIIPDDKEVLRASNLGTPVVLNNPAGAPARAYMDASRRLSGTKRSTWSTAPTCRR
jgi:hypothetical protein